MLRGSLIIDFTRFPLILGEKYECCLFVTEGVRRGIVVLLVTALHGIDRILF
jgi:hypothetical protein